MAAPKCKRPFLEDCYKIEEYKIVPVEKTKQIYSLCGLLSRNHEAVIVAESDRTTLSVDARLSRKISILFC